MAVNINNYMFKQNKYTNWYYQITSRAQNRAATRKEARTLFGYTERHHIIPEAMGGPTAKENLVFLTAREHFICHWLLTKMTKGKDYYSMISALDGMRRENTYQKRYKTKITGRVFSRIREECSNQLSQNHSGTDNSSSKITKEQVIEIYYSCEPMHILTKQYNMSVNQIYAIKRKKSYKKITEHITSLPGSGGNGKNIWIPLSDETVRKIYLEDGNFTYFNVKYRVTRAVIKNIKAKKTYKEITADLDVPGQFIKHKFTTKEAKDIYNSKLSSPKLAKKYGVSPETIRRIKKNKTQIYL